MYRESVPRDPMMLYSFINTKLRDHYASLDLLCEDMDLEKSDLINILSTIDMQYNESLNKFM